MRRRSGSPLRIERVLCCPGLVQGLFSLTRHRPRLRGRPRLRRARLLAARAALGERRGRQAGRWRGAWSPARARASARRLPRGWPAPGRASTWSCATAERGERARDRGRAAPRRRGRPARRALRPRRARAGRAASPPTWPSASPTLAVLVNNAGVLPRAARAQLRRRRADLRDQRPRPVRADRAAAPRACARARRRGSSPSPPAACTRPRLDGDDLQLDHRDVRRPALLRAHQARRGRPQRALGAARGRAGRRLRRDAPGLGRHAGPAALAAPLPPARAAAAPRRPPGRRHHRLAGHRARQPRSRAAGSGTTGAPRPPTGSRGPRDRRRRTRRRLLGGVLHAPRT